MYAAVSLDNNKMRVNILELHDDTRWKLFNTFVSHPSWPQIMAPVPCGRYCSLMQHGLLCACVAKLTTDWKKFKKWNRKSYFCKNNLHTSNYFSGSFSLTLYKTHSIKIYCKIWLKRLLFVFFCGGSCTGTVHLAALKCYWSAAAPQLPHSLLHRKWPAVSFGGGSAGH